MRYVILLLTIVIVGCGGATTESTSGVQARTGGGGNGPDCSDAPFLGTWHQVSQGTTMEFHDNCQGAESDCNIHFAYGFDNETLVMEITGSNQDPGCPFDGQLECDYEYPAENPNFPGEPQLRITCGGGAEPDFFGTQYFEEI